MLKSEAGRFFLGAIYSVGGRFFSRIVGLASTVVLARVLTPDDYGIVGDWHDSAELLPESD